MELTFTKEQIEAKINQIYLEDEDVYMEGELLRGEGKEYVIKGIATIEGERYHDFEIAFALLEEPKEKTAEDILAGEWDWYDFLC